MRDIIMPAVGVKEHKVAGLKIGSAHRCAECRLLRRRMREAYPNLAIGIEREARAVKSGRCRTAEYVFYADYPLSRVGDSLSICAA